jgi:hypothetical protein
MIVLIILFLRIVRSDVKRIRPMHSTKESISDEMARKFACSCVDGMTSRKAPSFALSTLAVEQFRAGLTVRSGTVRCQFYSRLGCQMMQYLLE